MRRASLVVLLTLFAFALPAVAKPSDWDDVVEKPGQKTNLPPPSKNAPQVVTKAGASEPTKDRAAKKGRTKAKAKTKKAPRRGKVTPSRR